MANHILVSIESFPQDCKASAELIADVVSKMLELLGAEFTVELLTDSDMLGLLEPGSDCNTLDL
jgi:hypothetical protein